MRRMRRSLVSLFLALAACDSLPFEPAGPDAVPDPSKAGPFPVGVRTFTVLDPERPRPDGSPRTLTTEVWYPAVEESRGKPGVSYDIRDLMTEAQRAEVSALNVPLLKTTAVRDAEVDEDHGPYPLVIFSHGSEAVRWQSTYLTVALASHGYVVAAPDHEGNTLYSLLHATSIDTLESYTLRPRDVTVVIDYLALLPESDPLPALLDLKAIGIAGHSFGGFTALRTAAVDARIKAIVPQAPPTAAIAWLDQEPGFRLNIPVLLQAAHGDQTITWAEHSQPTWELLARPRWLVDIVHGGHMTFSDLCGFNLDTLAEQLHLDVTAGLDVARVLRDGCGPNNPPAASTEPLLRHFAIAFFNGILRKSLGSMELLTQAKADTIAAGVAAVSAEP